MARALIISPVRSWPLDQGNHARLHAIGQLLRARGYTVHLLLSEFQGPAGNEALGKMSEQWDLLRSLPYTHRRRRRFADAWGCDDWYDTAMDSAISEMFQTWDYDLCIVNYVWFSRALERVPAGVFRAIDTHDAFGDRHKRLYEAGTSPVWFYTRPEEEGRGLNRADCVIAIQEEEQAWFESLCDVPVRTIGHIGETTFLPPRQRSDGLPWRIGYLASDNPSNRSSIEILLHHWRRSPYLTNAVELHVAGNICERMARADDHFLVKHGKVPDPGGFYAQVDGIVNPNVGGSGLKIKSVEALAYGCPIFSTTSGMLGICPQNPPYVLETVEDLVQHLVRELKRDPGLDAARRWARATSLEYRDRQLVSLDALLADIAASGDAPATGFGRSA